MAHYRDYFNVRPDYASIMTRESINVTPDTWLGFYPHESFVDILRSLIKSLDGGGKTPWITGAYGTGKSHASLVLQKLFCDDEARVVEWLKRRAQQVPEAVCSALMRLRKQRILVVYDVNSDGVDPKNQFLMRLQQGITQALRDGGHQVPARGRLDEVIDRIRQDERYFFRERDEIQGDLSYLDRGIKSADALEKRLRASPHPEPGLISEVMRVLEARSIYIELDAKQFLTWTNEIRNVNNFAKIVFIWDEFSAFVDHNRSQLKTFEQLAEAAQDGRFHFVPVTHLDISAYQADGSESAKKANSRFAFQKLDLPNETALKLAADAFVVKPGQEAAWERVRVELWRYVSGVVDNHMRKANVGIEQADFKGILPIHPMAAFLLKQLSVSIGANQRSMFEFLNSSEFEQFIITGGLEVESGQYLTVDYLWNYFIERDDLGTSKNAHAIRAEYNRRAKALQPEECRVFKVVLLFWLVEQVHGRDHALLSATTENIKRSFEGDGSMQRVDQLLRNLADKWCFSIVGDRCERYHDQSDSQEVQTKKKSFENKFDDLVMPGFADEIKSRLSGVLPGGRYVVRSASPAGASLSKQSLSVDRFGSQGGEVLVQFIVGRDAHEQLLTDGKAKDMAHQYRDHRMVFVTTPDFHCGRDNKQAWDEFCEASAKLALATDQSTKSIFKAQVNDIQTKWKSAFGNTQKLRIFTPASAPNGAPYIRDIAWSQLENTLRDYTKSAFNAFTDDLANYNITAFGAVRGPKNWALAGINFEQNEASGPWKTVIESYVRHGIRGDADWFAANPIHPLTQLRDRAKSYLDNTVGKGGPCSIRKLFIDLRRPPFGLLAVPHSAFVLGFVLKGFLTGQRKLQWTDGIQSHALDAETLADIIDAAIKDDGQKPPKGEKLICRLSPEEKTFITQVHIIFGGPPLQDATIENALVTVQTQVKHIGHRVPFWVLPAYILAQHDPNAESMRRVIEALCAAYSISSKGETEKRSVKVKEVGALLAATPGLAEALAHYMTASAFDAAFLQYIDSTRPELREMALRMGDAANAYAEAVKNRLVEMSGSLWVPGDVDRVIDGVFERMRCTEQVRAIAGTEGYLDFDAAVECMRAVFFQDNKIPFAYWAKKHPGLLPLFDFVERETPSIEEIIAFGEGLRQQSDILNTLFFDDHHEAQLAAMKDIFHDIWPNASTDANRLLQALSLSPKLDIQDFRDQGRVIIEEYGKALASRKITERWMAKTGEATPESWSRRHGLPAEFALTVPDAIGVIIDPSSFSSERVQHVLLALAQDDAFVDPSVAAARFMDRVLPARYQTIGLSSGELSIYLSRALGGDANRWLRDSRLPDTVDAFVRDAYQARPRAEAEAKVRDLSDTDAKALLLKLVREHPDVGLAIL